MKKDLFIYDEEELELLGSLENDEWTDAPLTEKMKVTYAQGARYSKSLKEKKQTTIRFSVNDLAVVKARAKEMGIGYQNLIQALVHNYVEDKSKLKL